MVVLAILSPALFGRLRHALGPTHVVVDATVSTGPSGRSPDFGALLHVDAIVVEPRFAASLPARTGIDVSKWPASMIILYTPLTPPDVRATMQFLSKACHKVVLAGSEDGAESLRRVVEGVPASELIEACLRHLRPRLNILPTNLREAVDRALHESARVTTVDALARDAGMSRRSLDRAIERANIRSTRRLLQAAHVVHAIHFIRTTRLSLQSVARRVGAPSARHLSAQLRQVLQMSAPEIRGEPDAGRVIATIVDYVVRTNPQPASRRTA